MARLLIAADSHVMEPLDLWTGGLPPHLRQIAAELYRFRLPSDAA